MCPLRRPPNYKHPHARAGNINKEPTNERSKQARVQNKKTTARLAFVSLRPLSPSPAGHIVFYRFRSPRPRVHFILYLSYIIKRGKERKGSVFYYYSRALSCTRRLFIRVVPFSLRARACGWGWNVEKFNARARERRRGQHACQRRERKTAEACFCLFVRLFKFHLHG